MKSFRGVAPFGEFLLFQLLHFLIFLEFYYIDAFIFAAKLEWFNGDFDRRQVFWRRR